MTPKGNIEYWKQELSHLVLNLTRKMMGLEKEFRQLEKELPIMLRKRIGRLVGQLEQLAKDGEKKLTTLVDEKMTPVIDVLETWLKEVASQHSAYEDPEKPRSTKHSRKKKRTASTTKKKRTARK